MGRGERAQAGDGVDLEALGFDGLNTNDWISLDIAAPQAGRLPADLPERLPDGSLIQVEGKPVAWLTTACDEYAPRWYPCADAFGKTGLWPLAVRGASENDLTIPWRCGGLAPAEMPESDAEEVLRRTFDVAADLTDAEPWQREWRGLAPAEPARNSLVEVQPPTGVYGLMLVPVRRPAESLERLGWLGATDYGLTGADLTAVFASWEDRFGAVLVGVTPDMVKVSVARPVRDPEPAAQLAREHYAFCPEVIEGYGGIEGYAEFLFDQQEWEFWWQIGDLDDAEA